MKRAESVRVAYPLFQTGGGGSTPTSALQLRFEQIDRDVFEPLLALWHSRLPKLKTACPCTIYYGSEFDGLWFAVAAWSPGSYVRERNKAWRVVQMPYRDGVVLPSLLMDGMVTLVPFQELFDDEWDILRPGEKWVPCWKVAQ